MKSITLYRSDFKSPQDGSGDSFFDEYLTDLGEKETEDIQEVTIFIDNLAGYKVEY